MKLKPIPDEVNVHTRPESTSNNLAGVSVKTRLAYAVDSTNTTRNASAKQWAGTATSATTEDNKGFHLTILSLTVRAQGGRAYKVMDQLNRVFDLREDALLEAISSVGILPGGILPGEWLWSLQGSEMKLIREGSAMHTALLEKSTDAALTPNSSPTPGYVYTNLRGTDQFLYLGPKDGQQHWIEVHWYRHKGGWWPSTVHKVKSKKVYGPGILMYPDKTYKYTLQQLIADIENDKATRIKDYGSLYSGSNLNLEYYDERIDYLKQFL